MSAALCKVCRVGLPGISVDRRKHPLCVSVMCIKCGAKGDYFPTAEELALHGDRSELTAALHPKLAARWLTLRAEDDFADLV